MTKGQGSDPSGVYSPLMLPATNTMAPMYGTGTFCQRALKGMAQWKEKVFWAPPFLVKALICLDTDGEELARLVLSGDANHKTDKGEH